MTGRVCEFCGNNLDGLRRDARYCSSSCRADSCRLRRLLRGESAS